jgi:putative acetyltransferase
MAPLLIREEVPADHDAVRDLNAQAFNDITAAELVDDLRSSGSVVVSLVAVENGEIVGHILFSDLPVEARLGVLHAVSLAPMAVLPSRQNQGIGSALVLRGLDLCRERGKAIVVVLGQPGYFPRFGFSVEMAKQLHGPYSGRAWMALELVPGALYGIRGMVRYPDAFGAFS